jgi:hypothetical protein
LWEFTLVLVETLNRKTASFEQKNRPGQVSTEVISVTGELHMPAKRIATEVQRKKSNTGKSISQSKRAVKRALAAAQSINPFDPQQCETTSSWGGRKQPLVFKWPPAARLVGIEPNPGPQGKGGGKPRAAQGKKKARPAKRKQPLRKSNPSGPNRMGAPRSLGGQNMLKGGNGGLGSTSTTRFRQTIEEDEYIGEVNGSVSFATTGYNINPGQAGTFPWGNKISQLYERYDFNYLEFYVCSEVSAYATQGQTGVVVLSCDYDASDVAPTTKQQVEDTDPHTKPCLPSVQSPIRLILDCAEMRSSDAKYVRPGAQPANTDIKTYDAGILYVSTQGNQNTTVIGELHVRYKCTLKKPVLESAVNLQGAVAHFSTLTATTANNFAGATLQSGASPQLNSVKVGATANVITFPSGIPGNYLILANVSGATSASAIAISSVSAGASALALVTLAGAGDDTYSVSSLAGTTTSAAMVYTTVTIAATGGTLTYSPSTIVTSGAGYVDVWVFALPTTLLSVDEKEQEEIDQLRHRADEQDRKIERLIALLSLPSTPFLRVDVDDESTSSSVAASALPLKLGPRDAISELYARKQLSLAK